MGGTLNMGYLPFSGVLGRRHSYSLVVTVFTDTLFGVSLFL